VKREEAVLHSTFKSILKNKNDADIFRLLLRPLGPFGRKVNLSGYSNPAKWLEPVLCALD
jgi:hypothetical protein